MCLSDVGRVVATDPARHAAVVDLRGRTIDVTTVTLGLDARPVAIGDWLVIHTGLAVTRIEPDEAQQIITARDEFAAASTPAHRRKGAPT